ncbi:hypothetical protein KW850_24605 [Bacillus sp. sid0103]|uniref:hypothetical protein n=1 Tax=Bacillus sp. sid0103 TaxID=2856337 RepID=UPI001C453FB1|nr:hypothetical protein [Bacillus sp. sid0103]MBV7508403.1 hypothetical protein [Bacillus sp. sid0103]
MDFFLVGIVYWLLVGAAALLFVIGVWKKSWKAFFWSGIALAVPTISVYVGGAEGWFRLAGLLPLLLWGLAFYTKK